MWYGDGGRPVGTPQTSALCGDHVTSALQCWSTPNDHTTVGYVSLKLGLELGLVLVGIIGAVGIEECTPQSSGVSRNGSRTHV